MPSPVSVVPSSSDEIAPVAAVLASIDLPVNFSIILSNEPDIKCPTSLSPNPATTP